MLKLYIFLKIERWKLLLEIIIFHEKQIIYNKS